MKEIEGKTAFITGGGSGIGLGMARVFANAGIRVIIADLRQDHLDSAVDYFAEMGQEVYPVLLDVSDRAGFEKAAAETEKVLKGIQRNDFYILPHPEFKYEFQESFDEIIAALPDEPFDQKREVYEEERRRSRREARERANAVE